MYIIGTIPELGNAYSPMKMSLSEKKDIGILLLIIKF